MQKNTLLKFLLAGAMALGLAVSAGRAQVVSSGVNGYVRDESGKPVADVTVTAVHLPTNATYTGKTNSEGRYYLRGLPVGGPYKFTTSAAGYNAAMLNDITTTLGSDYDLSITLHPEVVRLESFVVSEDKNALDASMLGTGSLLTSMQMSIKASTQRSLADLVSSTPTVSLRALSGDREEAMITALGQNNRYNSIMIDGNRINDQFGLNSTGLASFFNPLAIDTIEQLSVQFPYDVRYSGFTGTSINAVTRSGTNKFKGSAYYLYSGDTILGFQGQGPDALTLATTGVKVVPKLSRKTKGFTLGGPILKDHLFFFMNWEKFNRVGAPNAAGLPTVNSADLATISSRVAQISKVKYGVLGGNATSLAEDEKKLLKIDWNVGWGQRVSLRYTTTEGQVPQFGSFTTTSFGGGLNNNGSFTNLVGGATTSFDSHFYAQLRKEKSFSGALFSEWTPNLKTEVKWSHVKQDQYTPVAVIAPEIRIFGVGGLNQSGQTITNGVVVLGTERFRHGNQINVDTQSWSALAEYFRGMITYTVGFDREASDFYNLFRQFSYGVFDFATPADFLNDNPRFYQRNFVDTTKRKLADISQGTQTGIFGQMKWDISQQVNFELGVRYDKSTSDTRPEFNQQFLTDTGMRNDGTIDGATDFSPRFGFNWSVDKARTTQVHGGFGYFVGRAPWVFFSNSYNAQGVGAFTVTTLPTGGLNGYLANNFDPANPIGTGPQSAGSRAEIDLTDDRTHLPSLWRGNLSVDHRLNFLTSSLSLDLTYSRNDHTLFITNENLKTTGAAAADGRVRFAGNPSTLANAKYPNYTNIYRVRNVEGGQSSYYSLTWDRPMKDKWAFSLGYTRGHSTEPQAFGQTTASGQWQRNAVFNQGQIEVGRSDFEIQDRIQALVSRQFEAVKNWKTTVSLYYEGRTGNPFSYVYNSSDLNGDSFVGNDLVAVPAGPNDTRFDFSQMTTTDRDAYLAFMQSTGLSKFAGGIAPKNAFFQPWMNRLDLKVSQIVPIRGSAELELFMDWTNFGAFLSHSLFGYVERAPSTVNDVFERRSVGGASYVSATDGRIRPTFSAAAPPQGFVIDNTMSRWRIQAGARLRF
jgi:hypothetical protein